MPYIPYIIWTAIVGVPATLFYLYSRGYYRSGQAAE